MILDIQPLDEPYLQGHIEHFDGPSSALQPALAAAAETLAPGESTIVKVSFDGSFEIASYRGTTRHFKIERVA